MEKIAALLWRSTMLTISIISIIFIKGLKLIGLGLDNKNIINGNLINRENELMFLFIEIPVKIFSELKKLNIVKTPSIKTEAIKSWAIKSNGAFNLFNEKETQ